MKKNEKYYELKCQDNVNYYLWRNKEHLSELVKTNDEGCIYFDEFDLEDVSPLINLLNNKQEVIECQKIQIEFLQAHNKALIHTNNELHKRLDEYEKILELEYWEKE